MLLLHDSKQLLDNGKSIIFQSVAERVFRNTARVAVDAAAPVGGLLALPQCFDVGEGVLLWFHGVARMCGCYDLWMAGGHAALPGVVPVRTSARSARLKGQSIG